MTFSLNNCFYCGTRRRPLHTSPDEAYLDVAKNVFTLVKVCDECVPSLFHDDSDSDAYELEAVAL